MASPTSIIYVYHGQDEPTLRERLAEFCRQALDPGLADLNTTRLDGSSVQLGDIESACGALPFMGDTRLVIVENLTESNNGKTLIDELPEMFGRLPDSTRLVFVEANLSADRTGDSQAEQRRKAARRQAIKKLVNVVEKDPRGKAVSFDLPKDRNSLVRWMGQRAAVHGAEIERTAAELLAERINEDLVLADAELEKLATYVNRERPIRSEDVALLTPYTPEANIFNMVDALGQRNGEQALSLLRQLLEDGDDPLRIFAMIVRQYRLLLLMREQLDGGVSVNSAGDVLGLHNFVAKKLASQARHYRDLAQLERIYRLLLEIDRAMKTGQIEPGLALDQFVARLAR